MPLPDIGPRWRGGRPPKRWRYVGAWGPDVQLCAGTVRIASIPQSFFGVWDGTELRERTKLGTGTARLEGATVAFAGGRLTWRSAGAPITTLSRHGTQEIWTRKTPLHVTGTVDGRRVELDGLLDESAGWHARHTEWWWSAGVGRTPEGATVTWNLCEGVHDGPGDVESCVWVDGVPQRVTPPVFARDLASVGDLTFTGEAERARHDRMVLIDSQYRQPFGTFTGTLPGGVRVASGWGVMEHHDVRW